MPGLVTFFIVIVGLVVVGGIVLSVGKGVTVWAENNASEVLSRPCRVVDKRTQVWGGSGDSGASTNYYITFEFEDRERVELPVRANQYGLIAIGDRGVLTHQGTRFKGFERSLEA
ncbi:DUF2500 domain-containing protein [Cohnella fermenti]|uniref:DUF2500 domain-containing protein n=2 Tax=Cohnella fermenti TaxID=2565925 RepID=A0A4S4BFX9_9BACL|nr:DUF2500 domain-containing protein [Cohnella fermenti]